jgi:chemotaxis protein methyltransferase CheR
MEIPDLHHKEFRQFQSMIYQIAGISLSDTKKSLVSGRLAKRVRQRSMKSYSDYFHLLLKERGELQIAVDLLTTNETYFFREPKHFDFLRDHILPQLKNKASIRIWSGACSTGEEPYSIAMTLMESLGGRPWEVLASDISSRVLEKARAGHYKMEEAESMPQHLLRQYCLKGVGKQQGTFLVDPLVRSRVQFMQVNLNESLPKLGDFDVIFLRNVMIYFDIETKRQVVKRLLRQSF